MVFSNGHREAYTADDEATLLSLEIFNVGAFVVVIAGAEPGIPLSVRWTGPSGVEERRKVIGRITREPGRPDYVRVQLTLEGGKPAKQSRPWPIMGPVPVAGVLLSNDTNFAGAHGTGRRNNKPMGSKIGSRSTLIVPMIVGNQDHWDPKEGSGVSYV